MFDRVTDALCGAGIVVLANCEPRPVSGGDISAAWQIQTSDGPIFLKTGDADAFDMFEAEADGLRELSRSDSIRVPEVLATSRFEKGALLALEWLEFGASGSDTEKTLGRQLAKLHRTQQKHYGWFRNNRIGLTPQINDPGDNWVEFFREHRLACQLQLAARNGFDGELQSEGQALLTGLGALFDSYTPKASLLHGDLWGGNWSSVCGQPVIFDPAVYYGDRETDLAMTSLFGGFGPEFYRAYEANWPLDDGFEDRISLYQLYHVLNHLNLFGGGYLGQAMVLLKRLNKFLG